MCVVGVCVYDGCDCVNVSLGVYVHASRFLNKLTSSNSGSGGGN